MKRAGLVAIGGIVLFGGFLQQAPQYCPLPLRSFLGAERGVPIPQPRPAGVPTQTTTRETESLGPAAVGLQSADPATRTRALEALARIGEPASDALIERARRDPDPVVAKKAEELQARRR